MIKKDGASVGDINISSTFALSFDNGHRDNETYWRDGRVVDCTCLENKHTATYPGFESLSLRNESEIQK